MPCIHHDGSRSDFSAHCQRHRQGVDQEQFADSLSSKGEVAGQSANKGRAYGRVAGQFQLFHQFGGGHIQTKIVDADVIGRKRIVTGNPAVFRNQHIRRRRAVSGGLTGLLLQVAVEGFDAA